MHEIGIVKSMCKTVLDYARENNVTHVGEIVCEIGELSLVIPDPAIQLASTRRAILRARDALADHLPSDDE